MCNCVVMIRKNKKGVEVSCEDGWMDGEWREWPVRHAMELVTEKNQKNW